MSWKIIIGLTLLYLQSVNTLCSVQQNLINTQKPNFKCVVGNNVVYSKSTNHVYLFEDNGLQIVYQDTLNTFDKSLSKVNLGIIPNGSLLQISNEKNSPYYNFYIDGNHAKVIILDTIKYININKSITTLFFYDSNGDLNFNYIIDDKQANNSLKLLDLNFFKFIQLSDNSALLSSENGVKVSIDGLNSFGRNGNLLKSNFYRIANSIGIEVDNPKNEKILIDPVIKVWGTYYGGLGEERINKFKVDNKGNTYAVGYTNSTARIAFNGFQNLFAGQYDAFLAKFDNNSNLVWGTYFGGSRIDVAYDLEIIADSIICIVGETNSISGINQSGLQNTFGGGLSDAFIAKFDKNGNRLWSSYYGGEADDKAVCVSKDKFGNLYIAGYSESENNISSSGFQNQLAGKSDGFVLKLNPLNNRTWATYYGGEENDFINSIATDSSNSVVIGGITRSENNIAKGNTYKTQKSGNYDSFISKFSSNGQLEWGTYFGGSENDNLNSLACSKDGIYVAGNTPSDTGIVVNTNSEYKGGIDVFLARFEYSGNISYSQYFGGTDNEYAAYISFVGANNLLLAGNTRSDSGIATSNSLITRRIGQIDAYYSVLDTNFNPKYSSYFGSDLIDEARCIVANGESIYLSGSTNSQSDIATGNSHQSFLGGDQDAFLIKFHYSGFDTLQISSKPFTCLNGKLKVSYYSNFNFDKNNMRFELVSRNGDFVEAINLEYTLDKDSYVLDLSKVSLSNGFYKLRAISLNPYYVSNIIEIRLIENLPEISGRKEVCFGRAYNYSVNLDNSTKFEWVVTGGNIVSGQNSNNVLIRWNNISSAKLILKYEDEFCQKSQEIDISIIQETLYEFDFEKVACSGVEIVYNTSGIDPFENPQWTINGGIISEISENFLKVIWDFNTSRGTLILTTQKGECEFSSQYVFNISSTDIPEIIGNIKSCLNCESQYEAPESFAYKWDVENGEIIGNDNQQFVNIKWGKNGIGKITLFVSNSDSCQNSSQLEVQIVDEPFALISPRNGACLNEVVTFSTPLFDNATYEWKVEGAEILSFPSLNQVRVRFDRIGNVKIMQIMSIDNLQFADTNEYQLQIIEKPQAEFVELASDYCIRDTIQISLKDNVNLETKWEISGITQFVIFRQNLKEVQVVPLENGKLNVSSLTNIKGNKCTSMTSLSINVLSSPPKPEISLQGDRLIAPNYTTIWYRNDEKLPIQSNIIANPQQGIYKCYQISEDGCQSEFSDEIEITYSSVANKENELLKLQGRRLSLENCYEGRVKIYGLVGNLLIDEHLNGEFIIPDDFSGYFFVKIVACGSNHTKFILIR